MAGPFAERRAVANASNAACCVLATWSANLGKETTGANVDFRERNTGAGYNFGAFQAYLDQLLGLYNIGTRSLPTFTPMGFQ